MFDTLRTAKNFVNVFWWLFVDLRVSIFVSFVHPRIFLSFPSFVYFYFYDFFSFHFFLFFFHFFEILGKHVHSLRNKITEILSSNSEGKSRYIDQ